MKITALRTEQVRVPFDHPICTAIHKMHSVDCVLLYLETDQGLTGESYVFTLNATRLRVFDDMINSFKHFLIDKDPHMVQQIWQEINPLGHKGISVSALSAIDTALWDILGKSAGLPLHQLFCDCRSRIKTYASGGLCLSMI